MKVILEWDDDFEKMRQQLHAARAGLENLVNERDLVGVRMNGVYFGVKLNKDSVRVYSPKQESQE